MRVRVVLGGGNVVLRLSGGVPRHGEVETLLVAGETHGVRWQTVARTAGGASVWGLASERHRSTVRMWALRVEERWS